MYNGIYNKEQYAYLYDTLTKWLSVRIQGGSLGEAMRAKGIERVALYGVNGLGEQAYRDIAASGIEVVCLIDRNASRYGAERGGVPVFSLEQLEQVPEDCYILVTPEYYFREIMTDLLDRGISLERMISLSMLLG